ncbi:MAG: ABC transporter permease [Saprospiraceae bacterium]|nr:ABC transporter permease [Lewinella sp.]
MNLLFLSWKNLIFKPLGSLLSLVLFALGIGLISLLLLLQQQLQDNFERNLAGIDLVIGAKGSPLQLMLSSMYHIDAPTGNISLKAAKPFLRPDHPVVGQAIPLSLGDNYRGYRIVGTIPEIINCYQAELAEGRTWARDFEVNLGAKAAADLQLEIGDRFKSSHGFTTEPGMDHEHDQSFEVVGILAPSGTVLDQLILTTNQSYWLTHSHESEEDHETPVPVAAGEQPEEDHEREEESEEHHPHSEEAGEEHHHHVAAGPLRPLLEEDDDEAITALLVKYKTRNFQALNMQRNINENTDLQAATPAIEINRLFNLIGSGEQVLRGVAGVIIVVSGLSIFISLFSSLRERRYELALMRVMGGSRSRLFLLIILEGLLLAALGYGIGLLLSHAGMFWIAHSMEDAYRYTFSATQFLAAEGWLLLGALLIGFLASVIPAMQAAKTDIADTLVIR